MLATPLWWVPQIYARAGADHLFLPRRSSGDYARFQAVATARGARAWLLAIGPKPPPARAERLVIPDAPDRGTMLDFDLYRVAEPGA